MLEQVRHFHRLEPLIIRLLRIHWTNLPYIPGSTLKGKMRSLLARAYNDHQVDSPEKDDQRIIRLFGKAADKKNADGEKESIQGRLLFRDAFLNNKKN